MNTQHTCCYRSALCCSKSFDDIGWFWFHDTSLHGVANVLRDYVKVDKYYKIWYINNSLVKLTDTLTRRGEKRISRPVAVHYARHVPKEVIMLKKVVADFLGSKPVSKMVPYCDNCGAELPMAYQGVCKRCGFPRPFITIDDQGNYTEQYTDVALTQDINMVLDDLALDIRVPRASFNPQIVGIDNPELIAIREFLNQSGLRYTESGAAVVTFGIARRGYYEMTIWIDGISHGCRIVDDWQGTGFEISVTKQSMGFAKTQIVQAEKGTLRKILRFIRGAICLEN